MLLFALGVLFVVLKLAGVIAWSWWLVVLPFIVLGAAALVGIDAGRVRDACARVRPAPGVRTVIARNLRTPPPVRPVVTEQDRRESARARVLARLQRGPALNTELNDICFRYGARIHELRRLGYRIARTAGEKRGLYRYELTPAA